mmetsp:Transcript_78820/g.152215  ORF Transcript_78820/g.152215 Transcript_78820/m.152215 type:complete len:710 (+) Transcript_78820:114-2243(+)
MSLHCLRTGELQEGLPGRKRVQSMGEAAADPGSGRQVDEALWRQNCADFKDVMDAAKSVYLALEHHNEAAVRVAVEVVTDPVARKCLWWNDFWCEDDDKRDQWKNIIREKLPVVIGHATNSKPIVETTMGADPAALEALQQRAEQADTAVKAAQQQQKIAEMRCRELDEKEAQAREQVRTLNESLAQMRAELRRSEESCTSVQQRLALQEEKLHEAEKHKAATAQRLAEQEKRARVAEDSCVAAEEKLKKSEEARAVLEEKLKKGEEARAVLEEKSKAAEEKIKALQASTSSKSDEKSLHEMAGKFHAEKKRNMELEAQLQQANSANAELQQELDKARCMLDGSRDLESLQRELMARREECKASLLRIGEFSKQLEDALRRVQDAETRAEAAEELAATLARNPAEIPPKPASPDKSIQVGALMREIEMQTEELDDLRRRTKEQDAEVSELRKANAGLEREVEELRAKIPRKDERIGKLQEDKAALEEERMNMLRSIHALREKLKRITEIAEKKGYGKIVSEIMTEADIPQTLEGREFRCFERLYQDALRRQRNVRDRMQSMVSAGSPTLGAGVPVVQPQLRVGPSVTAEGYRFQRASSHLDLGGTGCVSTSPLPPGNAVLQRGSGHCYRQGADTVAGARASIVQPRPCNLGGQDAFRDFLQRGTSMRSSSIGRLLVRSSVSPVNQRSPAASTPTLPPTYLSFSRLSLRA